MKVASALGQIEDPAAMDQFSDALKDENWQVRKEAAEALGDIEDARAARSLSQATNDENLLCGWQSLKPSVI